MCTVSFFPVGESVLITSNRDEHKDRKNASTPEQYQLGNTLVLYPKDKEKNGTWISVKENGDAGVLLNGALVKHKPGGAYRRSRGLIFLDIFEEEDLYDSFLQINLEGIEPFTIILFRHKKLYDCRWDGEVKLINQLNPTIPHFWSSVTLYNDEISALRKDWFTSWLLQNPMPSHSEIIRFHHTASDGNSSNALVMCRPDDIRTVSVTSISISANNISMYYHDIANALAEETYCLPRLDLVY